MTEMKRALSLHEVRECEFAEKPECKCRCRGQYHGAARLDKESGAEEFRGLPATDPHHLLTTAEAKAAAHRRHYIRQAHNHRWGSGHSAPGNLEHIQTVRTYAYSYETHRNEGIEFPCPMCMDEGRDPKPDQIEAEA